MIEFTLNGKTVRHEGDPEMPLLWYVRDEAGLHGSKFGCGISACGSCTMHMDGAAIRSCSTPVSAAEGMKVTTIEGVTSKAAEAVRTAWRELDVVQCGYCQSGQMMSAIALLEANPKPSAEEVDAGMNGNICRCATYARIRKAVVRATELMGA